MLLSTAAALANTISSLAEIATRDPLALASAELIDTPVCKLLDAHITERHLNRLSFIRRSRDLGFSLDQVRALLDLSDDRDRPCEAIDVIAKEHLAEVERKIADLRTLRRELSSMIDQCRCGTVADCRIVEALSPQHTQ